MIPWQLFDEIPAERGDLDDEEFGGHWGNGVGVEWRWRAAG